MHLESFDPLYTNGLFLLVLYHKPGMVYFIYRGAIAGLWLRVRNKKVIFLILNQNMLWVSKKNVSMRRFFWAPKTYVKKYG